MKVFLRSLVAVILCVAWGVNAQSSGFLGVKNQAKEIPSKGNSAYDKINDSVPELIPRKIEANFGYVNQSGKVIIPAVYKNVGFFTSDCKLLNSPVEALRKYGTEEYASVRTLEGADYRIDRKGKRVYRFKESDLGKCPYEYKAQKYHSYVRSGYYGVIDRNKFENEMDYRQYLIYPQYQYLHIMEGDDLENPMIIAAHKNKFGVIDIHGNTVVPFRYGDIKRNFSWKLARLFEVSYDGKEYFFIDQFNNRY